MPNLGFPLMYYPMQSMQGMDPRMTYSPYYGMMPGMFPQAFPYSQQFSQQILAENKTAIHNNSNINVKQSIPTPNITNITNINSPSITPEPNSTNLFD